MKMHIARVGMTLVGLILPAAGFSDAYSGALTPPASVVPFAIEAAPPAPQCWLEHSQVQPAPVPYESGFENLNENDPKTWSLSALRPGSEHVDSKKMQRECHRYWTRGT